MPLCVKNTIPRTGVDSPVDSTGLRQRKKSVVATHFDDAVEDMAPQKLKGHLKKLTPAVERLAQMYAQASPHIQKVRTKCNNAWSMVKPYHPEEFLPVIVGLVMAFFGGNFIFILAAVEAFRMVSVHPAFRRLTRFSLFFSTLLASPVYKCGKGGLGEPNEELGKIV